MVVTILAFVAAIVLGGLLIAFTDPSVLHAWGDFFSSPGNAIAQAWDAASGAYVAIFEGSIFNPHTVGALFQQASMATALHDGALSAVFNPLSETAVNATPLILAGLSVALAFRAGLFNIGAQSQFIGGAILATWLGYGVNLPVVIHVVVCVIGAFAGGAVLGWIVGLLKARTGAHEVIVTIMLNYVMAVPPGLPAGQAEAAGEARLQRPADQPDHRQQRAPAAAVRHPPADQRRVPARAGLRGRRVVAAEPEHAGL